MIYIFKGKQELIFVLHIQLLNCIKSDEKALRR